ncbi:hypothetical protein T4A_9063 [Trichinella pseudospiralis]|uniref:Uncharacterized protein n=1 Tax=Trichinella pseudospiralis TaxID=6337 RepID=A0A0V1EBY4_TRIPS|nr:hypothetical protein T4A_9063 [Trichinella pseudospiralis]
MKYQTKLEDNAPERECGTVLTHEELGCREMCDNFTRLLRASALHRRAGLEASFACLVTIQCSLTRFEGHNYNVVSSCCNLSCFWPS